MRKLMVCYLIFVLAGCGPIARWATPDEIQDGISRQTALIQSIEEDVADNALTHEQQKQLLAQDRAVWELLDRYFNGEDD